MISSNRFDGEYRFLSNFYESPIVLPNWHPAAGHTAPTVEHAFQSAKTPYLDQAMVVLQASTPAAAKAAGRRVTLRPGWDDGRRMIMVSLLRLKFAPHSKLAGWLLETGNDVLVESNTWGDRYWGVSGGVGENWLGRCLMFVRAELDVMPEYVSLPCVGETADARLPR